MNPLSAPADAELVEKVAEYVDDPLGFVYFAYPWKEPGPLEEYDGPDTWQRELLEDIGREARRRGFDGLNAVLPIRQAVSSGHYGHSLCRLLCKPKRVRARRLDQRCLLGHSSSEFRPPAKVIEHQIPSQAVTIEKVGDGQSKEASA
jgi:hypothetical protein